MQNIPKTKTYLLKKISFFVFVFGLLATNVLSQGLQYRMVSYNNNEQARASTPFFNIDIFNQEKFTINYLGFSRSFQFFFDLLIGCAIATSVIVFTVSALQVILYFEDAAGIKEGKDKMKSSIVGLMIVLSTWLIINTVNPDLLRLPMFVGLDQIKQTESQSTVPQNVSGESF